MSLFLGIRQKNARMALFERFKVSYCSLRCAGLDEWASQDLHHWKTCQRCAHQRLGVNIQGFEVSSRCANRYDMPYPHIFTDRGEPVAFRYCDTTELTITRVQIPFETVVFHIKRIDNVMTGNKQKGLEQCLPTTRYWIGESIMSQNTLSCGILPVP